MKILVTGGAGFIGSAVVRHIINNTVDKVINVDKLTYAGNLDSLVDVSKDSRYIFEQCDICDRNAMDAVLCRHQPDSIMHLAAETHVDRSIDNPSNFIHANIFGTYTLLESARHYWQALNEGRKKTFRFHHISTDEVYGDLRDTEALFTETTPYAPSSPYSASKASADHLVRAWHRTYGLPVIVTNCSNNYGPYQFPEKLIPLMILNALEGRPLPIYGRGNQIRDWLYVEDHADALYQVITKGRVGESYNIGGNNEKQNIEVVGIICEVLENLVPGNLDSQAVTAHQSKGFQSLITHIADRPGHDVRYAIDASKIARELGWQPQETFASGIRKTVQWYLDNLDWCYKARSGIYNHERLDVATNKESIQ